MRVLVVEDNETSALVLEALLKKLGHETVRAQHGVGALQLLDIDLFIDLVISDIMMPEMDGLALLENVRKRPDLQLVSFVLCTGTADVEKVKHAAALGCKHFLVKPIKPPDLMKKIREATSALPILLREKGERVKELALVLGAYEKIARSFRMLIDEQLPLLEAGADSQGPAADPFPLSKVTEYATILGADRVLYLLRLPQFKDQSSDRRDPAFSRSLLREFKLLLTKLPAAPASTQPSSAAPAASPGNGAPSDQIIPSSEALRDPAEPGSETVHTQEG
jgi:CheY-like chemotaxis protein